MPFAGMKVAYPSSRKFSAKVLSSKGRERRKRPVLILCPLGSQRPSGNHWVSIKRAGYLPVRRAARVGEQTTQAE